VTEDQFKELFDRYFDPIRRYLYFRSGDGQLSTDLAQDTFLKVWERGKPLHPDRDYGLLYKIAGDLFVSHIRRVRLSRDIFSELEFPLRDEGPESELQYRELKENYQSVLAGLPEKQRTVFMMSRMEDLSYKEIAERLSISIKAVEKRMSAALVQMRKQIKS
jgi:RNA polymerase sigma-70 factor (ECF subfamily)